MKWPWPQIPRSFSVPTMHFNQNSKYISAQKTIRKICFCSENNQKKQVIHSFKCIGSSSLNGRCLAGYKWHPHCDVGGGVLSQQVQLPAWHLIHPQPAPTRSHHSPFAPFIPSPFQIVEEYQMVLVGGQIWYQSSHPSLCRQCAASVILGYN